MKIDIEEIKKLPKNERLNIIEVLIESIDEDENLNNFDKEEEELLDERLKNYEANPDAVISWEVIKANYLKRKVNYKG